MDTTILKRGILLLILFLCLQSCKSQYTVAVNVGSIENKNLKAKIDGNTRKLLTEINKAFEHKTFPILTGIEMSEKAKKTVKELWATSRFRTQESEIYEDILNLNREGMELRNIRLYFSEADTTARNQEGIIVYTTDGEIDDFYLSIGLVQYGNVMAEGKDIDDLRHRENILRIIENLRTSYNRKDFNFLMKIYSDDIVLPQNKTNSQIKENLLKETPRMKLVYLKQNKSEYMTKMQKIFTSNDYINIKFHELKVVQHNKTPNYYCVSFKQQWSTNKYTDENYVFFLINFSKHDAPEIPISTIQPRFVNGKEIDKRELFNINSF